MKTIFVAFVVCCFVQGLLGSHLKRSASTTKGACCVTFYTNSDYKGSSFTSCEDVSYVGDDFNDEITSFKFGDNCDSIIVFRDKDYGGKQDKFEGNVKNLKNHCMECTFSDPSFCWCKKDWNDRVSSIRILSK